ncbi:MAG: TolC family protein [Deltaproteobacteria bacterium]|nr:TolC family protein [Deltaproteobacteria bacterium]
MTEPRRLLLVLFAGGLLMAGTARAEPLTLQDALVRAEEVSAQIHLQELSSEAAEARWLADPRAGAPSIRLGVRDLDVTTVNEPDPGEPEFVARVRMPLPRPWDLEAAAKQGAATVAREDAELDAIRDDVREAVTRRFHALPFAQASHQIATRLVELRTQHAQAVAERRAEGLATALDWLDSEEKRRDAADDQAALAADVQSIEAELRLLLQWPVGEPLQLVPQEQEPRVAAPTPTREELLEGLEARDPRVREAEAEIARAEARLRRLQLRSLPWLDWAQGGAVFKAAQPVSFEVGVAVDVPVYMWSPARTRAASQELSSARLQRDEARKETEQRLASRLRSLEASRQRHAVERAHLEAIRATAEPLLDLADPLLELELQARMARASLRALNAFARVVEQLDRLDAEAHR